MRTFLTFFVALAFTPTLFAQHSVRSFTESLTVLSTSSGDVYGSLVIPDGDSCHTVVLLVADSGPTDRDGNQQMMRNNAFRLISTSLAFNNIATLRYDKRGVGASRNASVPYDEDGIKIYVDDVALWVQKLRRDGRFDKIVVAGHGEGAHFAMAAINKGAKVDKFISVAGGGRMADQMLKDMFAERSPKVRDAAYVIIDSLKMGHEVLDVPFFLSSMFRPTLQPMIRSMMKFDPQQAIRNISIPVLILQGDVDLMVKVEDARLLHASNPHSKLVVIAGMNHVMKECGSLDKDVQEFTYINPALPLSKQFVVSLVNFIKNRE